jgi:hypothetical protein
VLDAPVPGVRDVEVLGSDREAARLPQSERPVAASSPAAEKTAVRVEKAKARVAEVGDPYSSLVVDRGAARLPHAAERRDVFLGLVEEGGRLLRLDVGRRRAGRGRDVDLLDQRGDDVLAVAADDAVDAPGVLVDDLEEVLVPTELRETRRAVLGLSFGQPTYVPDGDTGLKSRSGPPIRLQYTGRLLALAICLQGCLAAACEVPAAGAKSA